MGAVSIRLGNYHIAPFKLPGVLELAGMVQVQAWGPGGLGASADATFPLPFPAER